MPRESTQLERKSWRRSWRWSTALHVGLMILIVVQALWLPSPFLGTPAAKEMLLVEQDPLDAEPIEVEMAVDQRPWIVRDAEDVAYAQIDLSDPRWDDILTEPLRRAERHDDTRADNDAGVLISAELMRSIESSRRQSEEDNLRQLAALSERLTQVSSEETIDELSGTIGRLIGTGARESKPKEKVEGPFDHSSGQPHDCKKLEIDGKVRYVLVMIDKAGRTQDVELDEANGEQMFKTMQLIKSNPLLERVYRGVVMGILDKMLAPQPPK